jgi:phosphatidylglycerophosphate synthase
MLRSGGYGRKLSRFLYDVFGWIPFTPNQITILAVLLSILGLALVRADLSMAFLAFLIAMFFDMLDGAIARGRGEATRLGAFLDGIADRIVEFLMLSAIFTLDMEMVIFPHQWWVVIILFFGSLMASFVKSYARYHDLMKKEETEKMPGILERAERVMFLLISFGLYTAGYPLYASYILVLTAILAFVTFLERFFHVVENAKRSPA